MVTAFYEYSDVVVGNDEHGSLINDLPIHVCSRLDDKPHLQAILSDGTIKRLWVGADAFHYHLEQQAALSDLTSTES